MRIPQGLYNSLLRNKCACLTPEGNQHHINLQIIVFADDFLVNASRKAATLKPSCRETMHEYEEFLRNDIDGGVSLLKKKTRFVFLGVNK